MRFKGNLYYLFTYIDTEKVHILLRYNDNLIPFTHYYIDTNRR